MSQNITLLGASYSDVPAVTLPKTGGGTAKFTDVTDTTASAGDVTSGKYFYTSDGTRTQGTGSGGSSTIIDQLNVNGSGTYTAPFGHAYSPVIVPSGTATAPSSISGTSATVSTGTNTLTLSKTVSVTPNVSTAGYVSSGTSGNSSVSLTANVTTQGSQTIHPSTSNQTISSGRYLTGTQTINAVTTSNLTAENIKNGVTITVGDSSDADCVASVTGTYSGGGGTSKNVQIAQSTSRATTSSYTKVCGDITVSKTGTYDVYWDCFRSTTSGTTGSQFYIGSTAQGTANTTFTNHVQTNHLSNVSLTANQKVSVYARSRGNNYYAYVGQLVIIES